MKERAARAIAYGVVALLAAAALALTPPLTEPQEPPKAPPAAVRIEPPQPVWHVQVDTLRGGETLAGLLGRSGLQSEAVTAIGRAAMARLDHRRIPRGMTVTFRTLEPDSLPSEVTFELAVDRLLHVSRTDSGWVSREERLAWTTDTIAVRGVIHSNLYDAMDSAAAALPTRSRAELAWLLADIFEYRVDMSRDLQVGDEFRLLAERSTGPRGATRVGPILAVSFALSGTPTEAVRHERDDGSSRYYDQQGKSMQAAFLRAPLAFRRISSVFGMRRHPILGVWRKHQGTDYAAAQGTPVRSIGEGTVVFAGRKGGYGTAVEIRHRNGFVSRYGHLRRIAPTARRGRRVAIGQTIGYVGMTGLATAPHLHFEVLVGGVARNPRIALRQKGGEPIPKSERQRFDERRADLIARLESADTSKGLAAAH